jgi:hypothetical protein
MKKVLVKDFLDFFEKLEEIKAGKIKIEKPEIVIRNLLAEGRQEDLLPIYLIPNNPEWTIMLFPSPVPDLFEFISTPHPFIVTYISVEHINRLFLYSKQIYCLLED